MLYSKYKPLISLTAAITNSLSGELSISSSSSSSPSSTGWPLSLAWTASTSFPSFSSANLRIFGLLGGSCSVLNSSDESAFISKIKSDIRDSIASSSSMLANTCVKNDADSGNLWIAWFINF